MFVFDTIAHRLKRGCETMAYPEARRPPLPDRHGGALRVDAGKCADGCTACVPVCPTEAITRPAGKPVALDLGRCLFCAACVEVCPQDAITQTGDHRMAVRRREDLVLGEPGQEQVRLAAALDEKLRKLFGRSLRLRQVSAGGCNACEADTNVLGTIGWDLGRFGIQFVASPRHADGLLITGPVTARTWSWRCRKPTTRCRSRRSSSPSAPARSPAGRSSVIPRCNNGAASVVPVDLFIPGCPPHPLTILDGLLRLLDRLEQNRNAGDRPNKPSR